MSDTAFVYVRSLVSWLVFPPGGRGSTRVAGVDRRELDELHEREIWLPAWSGDTGLIRERGDTFGLSGATPNERYASMPDDPDAMLAAVYAAVGPAADPHRQAFAFVGRALVESLLPAGVMLALFQAAVRIPGCVLVDGATDAIGRRGPGVARADGYGEQTEWIFNPSATEFLGARSYLIRETVDGPAGTITESTAVLVRGLVDRVGELPAGSDAQVA